MKVIGKFAQRHFAFQLCLLLMSVLVVAIPETTGAANPCPVGSWAGKPNAGFEVDKMSDMSDFDPQSWVSPQGDTIKIAVFAPFSGIASANSEYIWAAVTWVAHDINKRGGIWVDGKKKLIELIKADTMSKADQTKKISERMALQEKVHFFWGTPGTYLVKIIHATAAKYKIISMNPSSMSSEFMSAENFSRYAFQVAWTPEQAARALAYYYGQVRKKEKRFYILCQDYSYGQESAMAFKKGLQEYFPEAQIVGEDYHKLFLTDYAPYLTKIKTSNAEVLFTSDWDPDSRNLIKQARQMGITIPFAHWYLDVPPALEDLGVEATNGSICASQVHTCNPYFNNPQEIKFYKAWNNQWQTKWKSPYNSVMFKNTNSYIGSIVMATYWLTSVIERAKSVDPEKIIKVWEGDIYRYVNGKIVKMRACDHTIIQDLSVSKWVPPSEQKVSFNIPPYYWLKNASYYGPTFLIPAGKVLPPMDHKLDRCKGKNEWGE